MMPSTDGALNSQRIDPGSFTVHGSRTTSSRSISLRNSPVDHVVTRCEDVGATLEVGVDGIGGGRLFDEPAGEDVRVDLDDARHDLGVEGRDDHISSRQPMIGKQLDHGPFTTGGLQLHIEPDAATRQLDHVGQFRQLETGRRAS